MADSRRAPPHSLTHSLTHHPVHAGVPARLRAQTLNALSFRFLPISSSSSFSLPPYPFIFVVYLSRSYISRRLYAHTYVGIVAIEPATRIYSFILGGSFRCPRVKSEATRDLSARSSSIRGETRDEEKKGQRGAPTRRGKREAGLAIVRIEVVDDASDPRSLISS